MSDELPHTLRSHIPDKSKLPKSLHSLDWQPLPKEYGDGDRLLVAVPVCNCSMRPELGWHYDIEVIRILCDSETFSVQGQSGEPWGWDIYDVDWVVKL